jgi:branched-chain amino acid aminotransferase
MLEIRWHEETGWAAPVISPFHNLSMHPASKCLHYACQLFEGLKAYRGVDGKIRMFRPDMNMKRMQNSAERSYFPSFDREELIKCISHLIRLDEDFVFPAETNTALYIRPAMIGSEGTLGVHASNEGILFVLLSPVGSYFAAGQVSPSVSLLANPSYVRAWPGGTGDSKLGSNYGPTIYVQKKAAAEGFQQVLWLFGEDNLLTEAGTMNIMVVLKGPSGKKQLITPPLGDGLILPGVTRDSILALARKWSDVEVIERRIPMKEVQESVKNGTLLELFGAGTACIVSPVNRISFKGHDIPIPTGGELSARILKTLTDIHYARITPHEWARQV